MSRQAATLNCTEEEKTQLKKWSNGAKTEKRLHTRSRIILCSLENKRNIEIAAELNISNLNFEFISCNSGYLAGIAVLGGKQPQI